MSRSEEVVFLGASVSKSAKYLLKWKLHQFLAREFKWFYDKVKAVSADKDRPLAEYEPDKKTETKDEYPSVTRRFRYSYYNCYYASASFKKDGNVEFEIKDDGYKYLTFSVDRSTGRLKEVYIKYQNTRFINHVLSFLNKPSWLD